MSDAEVTLKIGGTRYAGWREVSISRGIEQLAGDFELTLTDKWAFDRSAPAVHDGQACQVLIGATPVITGWIDDAEPSFDANSHSLTVRGRDKAGDLVDCAALHAGQEFAGRTLAQVATDLLRPFGMGVRVETDIGGAFAYQHADPGDTVCDVLQTGAKMRGVLVVSDSATGDLVLTRAGSRRSGTTLRQGDNVLGGSSTRSQRDRFSLYRVISQQRETDFLAPEDAATTAAEVGDPGVARYRPTVIDADGDAGLGDCRTRARWERSVRAARGQRASVRVRGWLDEGAPWAPNTLVRARVDWLGLDGLYLIAGVEYSLGRDGKTTTLTLVPPGAYEVIAKRETDPTGDDDFFGLAS